MQVYAGLHKLAVSLLQINLSISNLSEEIDAFLTFLEEIAGKQKKIHLIHFLLFHLNVPQLDKFFAASSGKLSSRSKPSMLLGIFHQIPTHLYIRILLTRPWNYPDHQYTPFIQPLVMNLEYYRKFKERLLKSTPVLSNLHGVS